MDGNLAKMHVLQCIGTIKTNVDIQKGADEVLICIIREL